MHALIVYNTKQLDFTLLRKLCIRTVRISLLDRLQVTFAAEKYFFTSCTAEKYVVKL